MRCLHITLGDEPSLEFELTLGLADFAARQHPRAAVNWGRELTAPLIRKGSPIDGAISLLVDPREQALVSVAEIPIVTTSRRALKFCRRAVLADDRRIGDLAATYLSGRGYRKAVFVGYEMPYSQLRLEGFRNAFPGDVAPLRVTGANLEGNGVADRLHDLVTAHHGEIAVFCDNDWQASFVIMELTRRGIHVPRDCGVLGVGNDRLAEMGAPVSISSIDPNWRSVGFHAGQLIFDLIDGRVKGDVIVEIPPGEVVTRRSTDHFATTDEVVLRAARLIEREACHDLDVATVVRQSGVSRRALERRFVRTFGRGIDMEIRRQRLAMASSMLRTTQLPVSEIAERCCFTSVFHFSSTFKKRHGVSPSHYRSHRRIASF